MQAWHNILWWSPEYSGFPLTVPNGNHWLKSRFLTWQKFKFFYGNWLQHTCPSNLPRSFFNISFQYFRILTSLPIVFCPSDLNCTMILPFRKAIPKKSVVWSVVFELLSWKYLWLEWMIWSSVAMQLYLKWLLLIF